MKKKKNEEQEKTMLEYAELLKQTEKKSVQFGLVETKNSKRAAQLSKAPKQPLPFQNIANLIPKKQIDKQFENLSSEEIELMKIKAKGEFKALQVKK